MIVRARYKGLELEKEVHGILSAPVRIYRTAENATEHRYHVGLPARLFKRWEKWLTASPAWHASWKLTRDGYAIYALDVVGERYEPERVKRQVVAMLRWFRRITGLDRAHIDVAE